MLSKNKYDEITSVIIGAAIDVHKEIGPGLLESVYEVCLQKLLIKKGLSVKRQVQLPISFQGELLEKDFFIDMLVEDEIIIELKSVEGLLPIHEAQLFTYLKLSGKQVGLLINFNVVLLKDGIKRRVMGFLK